ncbi:MAG: redoxin domain-containing protein, partial [Desulfomonilaceae bacterium]
MIRFCTTPILILFLSFQWAFGASVEYSQYLANALKGANFHKLNFEAKANNLTFLTTQGDRIELRQFEGKLIVLTFWKLDTPECLTEIQSLEKFQSRYRNQPLEIIALNLVDPIYKIKKFVRAHPTKLLVAFDPDKLLTLSKKTFTDDTSSLFVSDQNSVAIYEIPKYPTSYIIDNDGKVLGFFAGGVNWNQVKLENFFAYFSQIHGFELARKTGQFGYDARQGPILPPKAPIVGGPTKKGPVQAPLGPQAPVVIPEDETPKSDIRSLPFQSGHSGHKTSVTPPEPGPTNSTESPAVTKGSPISNPKTNSVSTGQKKPIRVESTKSNSGAAAKTHKPPVSRKATKGDPFVTSQGKPAIPLTRTQPSAQKRSPSGLKESSTVPPGQLPVAKPYYPSSNRPNQIGPDSSE